MRLSLILIAVMFVSVLFVFSLFFTFCCPAPGPAGINPPVARFVYTVDTSENGSAVSFHDRSEDADGDIAEYFWEFGDGTTSGEQNPVHIYRSGGTYTVSLTVKDRSGKYSSFAENIVIRSTTAPRAYFSYSPVWPFAGETVHFTDLSHDGNGSIVTWHWDFGDGNTSSARNPSHVYSGGIITETIFTVTLRVTDDDGEVGTYSTGIAVRPV
ncbi:MAG: PKD domain-containing protein [Candidatus Hadarchaeales archaeon]